MSGMSMGFALCGSFCNFDQVLPQLRALIDKGWDVTPVMSETAYSTDTRFGPALRFRRQIEELCGRSIVHTIAGAELFGPSHQVDLMVIAPCTGNTLNKLAAGITDTAVTMAAKAHLRNGRPLLLAIATNDALSASARGIGELMNRNNLYFVPFGQDSPTEKPTSCIADFTKIPAAADAALEGRQLQPVLITM